jgi:Cu/Zn superoxide dismutase
VSHLVLPAPPGHFNPYAALHGCWPNPIRHAGDILAPFSVDQTATPTTLSLQRDLIQLGGASIASVIGRSVVIHAAPLDDCTDGGAGNIAFTGNAGKRVAQGVIGVVSAGAYTNVARSSQGMVNFTSASAQLQATSASGLGAQARGNVQLSAADAQGNTRLVGSFVGLEPGSTVQLAVHTYGDLRSADGSAIGARVSGANTLNTLQVDAAGAAKFDIASTGLSLAAAGSIIGRALALEVSTHAAAAAAAAAAVAVAEVCTGAGCAAARR